MIASQTGFYQPHGQGYRIGHYVYSGTLFMSGNPNRYFRSKETGEYFQDKFQFRSNLTITAGLAFRLDGRLYGEKW